MTVERILIVSGTHGNEINPVWAVKQFNREENSLNHGIEYEYIIGNPNLFCSNAAKQKSLNLLPYKTMLVPIFAVVVCKSIAI